MTDLVEQKSKKKNKPATRSVQTELPIADAVDATEAGQATEADQAIEAVESTKPARSTKRAKPVKTAKLVKPVKPARKKSKPAATLEAPVSDIIVLVDAPITLSPKLKSDKVKAKLVRDSFTMPQEDYSLIGKLKDRAILLRHPIKKGELLRAGLRALDALDDTALLLALAALPALKVGRPKKSR